MPKLNDITLQHCVVKQLLHCKSKLAPGRVFNGKLTENLQRVANVPQRQSAEVDRSFTILRRRRRQS